MFRRERAAVVEATGAVQDYTEILAFVAGAAIVIATAALVVAIHAERKSNG